MIIKSLEVIAIAEIELLEENLRFKDFIRQLEDKVLDSKVHRLNHEIEPQIDCTACGNCCQTLMIHVTETECASAGAKLKMTSSSFKEKYVETSMEGQMIINTIPCSFLAEKKCSIYENRFTDCRAFPNLDQPDFRSRIYGTLMHYGRCPIIFNVIESLKKETNFKPGNTEPDY